MNDESFKILFAALASEADESTVKYTELRNSLVRYFQIKGDADADEAADETLDRVALKLSQNAPVDNVTNYSFGAARLIFLERLRKAEKTFKAEREFYKHRTSDENAAPQDDFRFFRECFDRLNEPERRILIDYFADLPFFKLTDYREKLSREYDVSLINLRVKIYRLRVRLEDCLKNKLSKIE